MGSAVAILTSEDGVDGLTAALTERYYAPRGLDPAVEICVPVEGACVLDL